MSGQQTTEGAFQPREPPFTDELHHLAHEPVGELGQTAGAGKRGCPPEPRQVQVEPFPLRCLEAAVERQEEPMVDAVAVQADQRHTAATTHDVGFRVHDASRYRAGTCWWALRCCALAELDGGQASSAAAWGDNGG